MKLRNLLLKLNKGKKTLKVETKECITMNKILFVVIFKFKSQMILKMAYKHSISVYPYCPGLL